MITQDSFRERLDWTLGQKIDHSLYIIDSALSYCGGNAFVSFSGGKDSTVLLSLARIIKPDIKAVFFNTTNEFPEIYKFIRYHNCKVIQPEMNLKSVIERTGFPLISKEQSQFIREVRHTKSQKVFDLRINGIKGKRGRRIASCWQYLINAPFEVSEKCCYWLKKKPSAKFEKKERLLPLIGTLAYESQLRKQKYLKTGCNAFEMNRPASYPLSIWKTTDIWDYIHQEKIPYCEIYDKGETMTGCMICGFGCHRDDRFKRLQENYPRVFEIGMSLQNSGVTYREAIQSVINRGPTGGKWVKS